MAQGQGREADMEVSICLRCLFISRSGWHSSDQHLLDNIRVSLILSWWSCHALPREQLTQAYPGAYKTGNLELRSCDFYLYFLLCIKASHLLLNFHQLFYIEAPDGSNNYWQIQTYEWFARTEKGCSHQSGWTSGDEVSLFEMDFPLAVGTAAAFARQALFVLQGHTGLICELTSM